MPGERLLPLKGAAMNYAEWKEKLEALRREFTELKLSSMELAGQGDSEEQQDLREKTLDEMDKSILGIHESYLKEERPPGVYRQSFWAYLRCMWSLTWTAFRHPLQTTVIDWSTGRVMSDEQAAEVLRTTHG
jgi:hypothetical protein